MMSQRYEGGGRSDCRVAGELRANHTGERTWRVLRMKTNNRLIPPRQS
ncbi:hypothetical protein KCP69_17335 [Salmonella enterica subsp. enterica]|nr:hypothetical protein KCP69_17335 [Salmonella enterica subsp. enterica]